MTHCMDFVIAPAISSDIGALLQIENRVFALSDGRLTRRAFLYHRRAGHILLTARLGDSGTMPLGYVLLLVHKRSARLYSLAVDTDFQGQGIARALIEAALSSIEIPDIRNILLEVRETNAKAIRLYEAFGFKAVERIAGYYGPCEHGIRMRLERV